MRRSSLIILLFLVFTLFLNSLFPRFASGATSLPEGWTVSSSNAQWGTGWGENNGETVLVDAPLKTNEKAMELVGHHVSGTNSRYGITHLIPGLVLSKAYTVTAEVFVPSDSNSQMVEVLVQGWNTDYSKQFQVVAGNILKINTNLKNQWQTVSADFAFTDPTVDFSKVYITFAVWQNQKAIFERVKIDEKSKFNNLSDWTITSGQYNGHGSGLVASQATIDNKSAILFGEVSDRDHPYPVGYVSAAKTFTTTQGSHEINFVYNVFSKDLIWIDRSIDPALPEPTFYFDSFEVSINLPAAQIQNSHRDTAECNKQNKINPDIKAFTVLNNSVIFCAGGWSMGNDPPAIINPWVSGWRVVTLDFANFINQSVTLYVTQWSREWDSDYWNDNAWFNSYSYFYASRKLNEIVSLDFSSVSCPRGELGNLDCGSEGLINTLDLSLLFSKWTPSGLVPTPTAGQRSADIAPVPGDGKVDSLDLSKMLLNWGK